MNQIMSKKPKTTHRIISFVKHDWLYHDAVVQFNCLGFFFLLNKSPSICKAKFLRKVNIY